MRSNLYVLAAFFVLLASPLRSETLTVTTPDNSSGPDDAVLSLLEALRRAKAGDTIAFDLPGAGPHVLVTPLGGYPFIRVDGLTIDGYTQPGSSPNTARFEDGNNARLQIVLDSRSDDALESSDPEQPDLLIRRSTRMLNPDGSDISGYGSTENGMLAVFGAKDFTVRGLSFLARHTAGSTADPAIYAIALAKASVNARVQGCWFGLHPDKTTLAACRSAVAAFRFNETVNGQTVGVPSTGLVFGTDGDGGNDRAERNLSMGMSLALALELPGARVSGNLFNVFPDGYTFLDVRSYAVESKLASIESFENGRFRENTLIGTNGDGVSDEEERNVFAPSMYDHVFEFYGGNSGTNVVIAGNHFGVGSATANGLSLYPFGATGSPDFFQMNGAGDVRIGSNGDGVSDELEANLIYGLGGDQLVDASLEVSVVARGNWIQGSGFVGFPFKHRDKARDYDKYFSNAILGPLLTESEVTPHLLDAFEGFFTGTVPVPNLGNYPYSFVDVYVVDTDALREGRVLPGRLLTTFVEGSTQDLNENAVEFRCSLGLFTAPAGAEIVTVVTYSKHPDRTEPGYALTGPVSDPVTLLDPTTAAGGVFGGTSLQVGKSAGEVQISWRAEEGIYRLEAMEGFRSVVWRPVLATADVDPAGPNPLVRHQVILPTDSASRFYRLTRW